MSRFGELCETVCRSASFAACQPEGLSVVSPNPPAGLDFLLISYFWDRMKRVIERS